MKLNIIVAVDEMGGFGKNGEIPWNIKADMDHFKKVTKGAVCVMGRKTYSDIIERNKKLKGTNKKLLSDRDSYVISRSDSSEFEGAERFGSIGEVLAKYKNTDREVFILGGFRMFVEVLAWKPTIYMTIIKGNHYQCDVHFPIKSLEKYKIVDGSESTHCTFVQYEPV